MIASSGVLHQRHGRNYYVATAGGGGSDANPGTLASPVLTISHAAALVAAGDNVVVRSGSYPAVVNLNTAGTAAKNISYYAYPGETVTIDGTSLGANTDIVNMNASYNQFKGFTIQNGTAHGIVAFSTTGCIIANNTITGCTKHGIFVGGNYSVGVYDSIGNKVLNNLVQDNVRSNVARTSTAGGWSQGMTANTAQNTLIQGNSVIKNSGEGIGDVASTGTVIRGNTCWDNYSVNIYIDGCINTTIDSNFCYADNNTSYYYGGTGGVRVIGFSASIEGQTPTLGISGAVITNNIVTGCNRGFDYFVSVAGHGMTNCEISNNTFTNTGAECIRFSADASHSGNHIRNNISYQNAGNSVRSTFTGTATGVAYDHNVWFGSSAGVAVGTGDVTADPTLVSPGTFTSGVFTATSFKPQAGSPALAAGATIAAVPLDYLGGAARAAPYSIGAYQS